MIARIFTVDGQQVALLLAKPNWATEVTITLELPTDVSKEAITFTESRRNFAQSARYKMKWSSYMSNAADATELRLFLTRVRGESIVVPLWTDMCELAVGIPRGGTVLSLVDLPARFSSNWIITNSDFSLFEIVAVASLSASPPVLTLPVGVSRAYGAGSFLYPLMAGRLTDRPRPESITDESFEAEFTLQESSTFSARLTPLASSLKTVGANIPAFATLPKWDVMPNWSRPLDWTEMPDIVYEHVGFMREDQQRVYDHRTARGQQLEFYQNNRADIAKIEFFWRFCRATTLRFMIPTFRGDLRMLQDTPVPGNPTYIVCESSFFSNPAREAQPGDPFIAVIDKNDTIYPYQISRTIDDPTVSNTSTLIINQNVATHDAQTSILSHLLLARFAEATLEWVYTTPYLATTQIKFQELPHEYASPPTPLKEPAYLFIFREAGIRTDLYTSYENTITISDTGAYRGTYVPAPFSFDTVKTGLKLDQEKLELKSFKFDGNPLNRLWPFALNGVLTLEIVEVDAVTPRSSTAVSRFYGDVWSVDSSYKAELIPFGNLFDRKFPRFLLSVSDNYVQFSPPTKLTPSAFKMSGVISTLITSGDPQTITVASVAAYNADSAGAWFAGGWLETGTGALKEQRGILNSARSGTSPYEILIIDRPLLNAVVGQSIDVYPGYDGSIDQCDTKFNNRINFGGQPYIPNVNPGVKAIKPKQTQGGKKA